jgi:hypothetical protein
MAHNAGSTKGRRGQSGKTTNTDDIKGNLDHLKNEFDDYKKAVRADRDILTKWNERSDESITKLQEQVKKLEDELAKRSEGQGKVEGLVSDKLKAFVQGDLATYVGNCLSKLMDGVDFNGKIAGMVKKSLGLKGTNGTILSVESLDKRGKLKTVEELKQDKQSFYKTKVGQ